MVFEDNGNLLLYQNKFGLADDGKLVFYNKVGNSVLDTESEEKVTFSSGNEITFIKLEPYYLALNITQYFKPKLNHRSNVSEVKTS